MRRLILPLSLLAPLVACEVPAKSDTGETATAPDPTDPVPTDTTAPDTGDDTDTEPIPTGDGVLSFEVVWGGEPPLLFQGSTWQAILDLNVYSPTDDAYRAHAIVVMLCGPDDPTCLDPVLIREVAADESSGDIIQSSFGPDVILGGLPEGEHHVMVFVDSGISRAKGFAWDDGFPTTEAAWGGVVSELDAMMTPGVQAQGVNPPPEAALVTITAAGTDLGTLELQHLHERDVSPPAPADSGAMVVGVHDGLRIVDLATYAVEDAAGFAGPSYELLTPALEPVDGEVCGVIDGGDGVVWALVDGYGVDDFAVPFDVRARAQAAGYHRVVLPGGDTPCRGVAGDVGGRPHLLITDAGASRMAEPEGSAAEGLWLVDVSDLDARDLTATRMDRDDDPILQAGVDDVAIHDGRVYLSISPSVTDNFAPAACRGFHCVYDATPGSAWSYTAVLEQGDGLTTDAGDVTCSTDNPWAGLHAARFHDGRDLLFVGGCTQVAALELPAMELVDLDPALIGQQNLDATLFGQGFTAFSASPSGVLWVMPQEKSPVHFFIQKGHEPDDDRQTYNRYMALPIDLSAGDEPALHAAWATGDLDGYAGETDIGAYVTPADDPGVDVNFATYVVHQLYWLPSTAGSTFQAASIPVGPSLAATDAALWVRGSGIAGVSGLGKAGDVEVIDLASRAPVLFPWRDDDPFYPFFEGGEGGEHTTGFDVSPEHEDATATVGLVYVP